MELSTYLFKDEEGSRYVFIFGDDLAYKAHAARQRIWISCWVRAEEAIHEIDDLALQKPVQRGMHDWTAKSIFMKQRPIRYSGTFEAISGMV